MTEETQLSIAEDLALPHELVVSKIAILGMSGSGKTQTARKLAEAMMEANTHIIVFAPAAGWYGLRSSADGKSKGFPIIVFGGDHRDAPLRPDSGAVMAALVIKKRFNAIFDMSDMTEAEVRQFAIGFLGYLNMHNRHPIHLFLDEFDIICPQQKGANSEESRSVLNTTVRRGRLKGIGETMITQNPQDVDKSVLNMANIQIVMRTAGSQAIDRIKDWLGRTRSREEVDSMVRSLPELPTGEGWISAPTLKLFGRFKFLLCKTFDSSQTPSPGQIIAPPAVLADVDVTALGKQIEDQVKEEQESDVDFLKEQVKVLKQRLMERGNDMGVTAEAVEALEAEVEELRPLRDQIDGLQYENKRMRGDVELALLPVLSRFDALRQELVDAFASIGIGVEKGAVEAAVAFPRTLDVQPIRSTREQRLPEAATAALNGQPQGDFRPNQPQQLILNAIATLTALRIPYTDALVAVTAGTTARARGFEENVRQLRGAGLIDKGAGKLVLTEEGAAIAVGERTLPNIRAVVDRLKLSTPQADMLLKVHAGMGDPEALAKNMSTTTRSRGYEENVRQLIKAGYIVRDGGRFKAVEYLARLR